MKRLEFLHFMAQEQIGKSMRAFIVKLILPAPLGGAVLFSSRVYWPGCGDAEQTKG